MSERASQVAAARDHTVVLTEEGNVYTFGLNRFHQLGLNPPPAATLVPKHVSIVTHSHSKATLTKRLPLFEVSFYQAVTFDI